MPGSTEPVAWTVEPAPSGGSIVRAQVPATAEAASTVALTVSATLVGLAREASVPLPRVRPVGARLADETWTVRDEAGVEVEPRSTHGLAWIDPATVGPAGPPPEKEGLRDLLAWRWTDPDGSGTLDRRRPEPSPKAEAWTALAIEGARVRFDWFVALDGSDGPTPPLPIALGRDPGGPLSWRLAGDDGAPIPASPVPADRRASLGLPMTGPAWTLSPPPAGRRGRVVLHARLERAWTGRESVPTLILPPRFGLRGGVLVAVDPTWLVSAEATGPRALDPSLARRAFAALTRGAIEEPPPAAAAGRARPVFAFGYDGRPGPISLATEPLRPVGPGGLIEEARLRSLPGRAGRTLHRLTLTARVADAEALEMTLPEGSTLLAAADEDGPVTPLSESGGLLFPIGAGTRRTLTLQYESPGPDPSRVGPGRPRFSLPCLAFRWEVDAPPGSTAEADGPDLVDADPRPEPARWPTSTAPYRDDPAALEEINDRLGTLPEGETTLGDLLLAWDSGRRPVVVDRDALAAAGLGPDSVASIASTTGRTARGVLAPLALTVLPCGKVLLVTSRAEATREGGPASTASAAPWARRAGAGGAARTRPTASRPPPVGESRPTRPSPPPPSSPPGPAGSPRPAGRVRRRR